MQLVPDKVRTRAFRLPDAYWPVRLGQRLYLVETDEFAGFYAARGEVRNEIDPSFLLRSGDERAVARGPLVLPPELARTSPQTARWEYREYPPPPVPRSDLVREFHTYKFLGGGVFQEVWLTLDSEGRFRVRGTLTDDEPSFGGSWTYEEGVIHFSHDEPRVPAFYLSDEYWPTWDGQRLCLRGTGDWSSVYEAVPSDSRAQGGLSFWFPPGDEPVIVCGALVTPPELAQVQPQSTQPDRGRPR